MTIMLSITPAFLPLLNCFRQPVSPHFNALGVNIAADKTTPQIQAGNRRRKAAAKRLWLTDSFILLRISGITLSGHNIFVFRWQKFGLNEGVPPQICPSVIVN
jgi:hypothetical protein